MFLRCKVRRKDGKQHRSWSVVENTRIAGGRVVQRHVPYLGEINGTQELAWRRGKSARWVLSGGTGTRSQAHSVRALARKCQTTARLRNGLPLRGSSLPTRRRRRFRRVTSGASDTRAITGRIVCRSSLL